MFVNLSRQFLTIVSILNKPLNSRSNVINILYFYAEIYFNFIMINKWLAFIKIHQEKVTGNKVHNEFS